MVKSGKEMLDVATTLVSATAGTEGGKQAANELGKTAYTITKAFNNCLLPIAAVNFGFDKARAYFETVFEEDFEEVTAEIPAENIKEPTASVAGPTLQGLAFSYEEEGLKKMYLNLLATAVDNRKPGLDHPSFAEIIRQLTGEEASYLSTVLPFEVPVPICRIVLRHEDNPGRSMLQQHLIPLTIQQTSEPLVVQGLAAMIDNWMRLGLVAVQYDQWLTKEQAYDWVETRPEFMQLKEVHGPDGRIDFDKGILIVTDFGKKFKEAVL